jgi:hypothetical protein
MAEMAQQPLFEAFDTVSTSDKGGETEVWDFRSLADSTGSTTTQETEQEGTMDTDEAQILPAQSE